MILIIIATHVDGYMKILEYTCKKNNIEYVVLKPHLNKKYEYIDKFYYINEYINKLDNSEIIICMDAYDTFITASHDEILNKYIHSKSKFLVGSHNNCNKYFATMLHNLSFKDDIMNKKILNAGMWISKVSYAKEVINLALDLKINDDQMALIKVMKDRPDLIQLDNDRLLFANLQVCDYVDAMNVYLEKNGFMFDNRVNRIKSISNHNYPCFIHGPSNIKLCNLIYKIYPEITECNDITTNDYIKKRLTNKLFMNFLLYLFIIILGIIFLIYIYKIYL